jgi:hypothetical protein
MGSNDVGSIGDYQFKASRRTGDQPALASQQVSALSAALGTMT